MSARVTLVMRSGERGHFNAAFALGRRLKAFGLDVDFVGVAQDRQYVVEQGFSYRTVGEKVTPADIACDLLVIDQAMQSAAMVAAALDQPFVTFATTLPASPASPPAWSGVIPSGSVASRIQARALGLAERMFAAPVRQFKVMNLPELSPWKIAMTELCRDREVAMKVMRQNRVKSPLLVACPDDFDFPAAVEQKPDHVSYIEPCIDAERKGETWVWPEFDSASVRICGAMGSTHLPELTRFAETLFTVMRKRSDWRLVCSTLADGQMPADVPHNVQVLDFMPQLQVLAKSSLMITHCGLNSVKEAITQGVPMIGVPARRDQPSVCARVRFHGLGFQLSPDASAAELEALIETITADRDIAANLTAMQARFNAVSGEAPGASMIHRLAMQHAKRGPGHGTG